MSLPREVLAKYLKPGMRFIETGTRWGDTCIEAIRLGAFQVWSCEADKLMSLLAYEHVMDHAHGTPVSIEHSQSTTFLRGLNWMTSVDSLVYLDAHTEKHSPVLEELGAIQSWPLPPKVILIDDLRCMKDWGVEIEQLMNVLSYMGYLRLFENGVEPNDILVGVRQ
jgi:hypothetical protein